MSTMLQAIMCYLFDEPGFLSAGRTLNMEAHEGRRCSFRSELERYQLIRYSNNPAHTNNFLDNLVAALRNFGVPEHSLAYIKEQLTSGRTVHVTADSEARVFYEKRLMSSPFLLEYVFHLKLLSIRLNRLRAQNFVDFNCLFCINIFAIAYGFQLRLAGSLLSLRSYPFKQLDEQRHSLDSRRQRLAIQVSCQ
uniref:Uncharacterized protein n=1 Tax=Panagrellus redivivus TaxID=6233 RepID=A0A7E4ZSM9_PANRE